MSLPKKNFRAGEIATFLTLVTLGVMIVGSFVGSKIAKRETTSSQAAGSCGASCTSNAQCARQITNARGEKVQLACDTRAGKCLPASNLGPRCDSIGGSSSTGTGGEAGNCGAGCDSPRDCNGQDTQNGIFLRCDLNNHFAKDKKGTCVEQLNQNHCPNMPVPTAIAGGSTGGSRLPITGGVPISGIAQGGTSSPITPFTQLPTSTGTGSYPQGSEFRATPLRCGGVFAVIVDPIIKEITISSGLNKFFLRTADETTGIRRTPVEYRTFMNYRDKKLSEIDNVKVDFSETSVKNGKRAVTLHLQSGAEGNTKLDAGYHQDENIFLYYYNNVPSFVFDSSPKQITLDYVVTLNYGRSNQRDVPGTQTINTNGCGGGTPDTGTPTPSVGTPTETKTPTPTKTGTPTPSVGTPTPPSCNGSIHFIIDDTQSVKPSVEGVIGQINSYLNNYFQGPHKFDTFTVSYDLFNRHILGGKTTKIDNNNKVITIDYTQGSWTNIKEALEKGVNPNAGVNIIVTDGKHNTTNRESTSISTQLLNLFQALNLPSWVSSDINQTVKQDGQCVFADNSNTLVGCMPCSAHEKDCKGTANQALGIYVGAASRQGDARDRNFCAALCSGVSKSFTPQKVDYAISLGGGDVSNLAKEVIDPSNIGTVMNEILKKACVNGANKLSSGSSSRGRGGSFNASFNVKNRSTTKQVQSMTIKACDSTGNNCVESNQQTSARPGDTIRVNQSFSTRDITSNQSEQLKISCTLSYADGSTGQCPAQTLGNNDRGLQLSMNVGDGGVTGNSRTYRQASDLDGNGVVNALDGARFIQQYGSDSEDCDIVADGKCNAQDFSVVQGNFGVKVDSN